MVRTGSYRHQARHQALGTLGMSCVTQVEEWSHDQDQWSHAAMLGLGPGQPSSGAVVTK